MSRKEMQISNGRLGAALTVHTKPNASQDRISVIHSDGTLVVDLACESETSAINIRLIQYLGKLLNVSNDQIEIIAGESGAKKIVTILDVSSEYVNDVIMQAYH